MESLEVNYELNDRKVSMERLAGECLLISFITGNFYNSLGSGADILTLIASRVPRQVWSDILRANYSNFNDTQSGISDFISILLLHELIKPVESLEKIEFNLPPDQERKSWSSPELFIHDDLQGLMLVDPIHESGDEGWPKLKNE